MPAKAIRSRTWPGPGSGVGSSVSSRSSFPLMTIARTGHLLHDGGHAAVDEQVLARDEARGVGAQVDQRADQLLETDPPASRGSVDHPGVERLVLDQGPVHLGGEVAR